MSLTLKVLLEPTNQTKVMKFSADMGVGEAIATIKEKTEIGGADFGLFQPVNPRETYPRWLKENRTLLFYSLENNDEIHYRKKHKALKIKLLDGTVKTMLLDLTLSVSELTDFIGEKIELAKAEEYSLQFENPQQNGQLCWLQAHKTVEEQGIKTDEILLLKKKFFYSDANISLDDPMGLHLLFIQASDLITSGIHPVPYGEVISLAGIHCQVLEGRYNPEKHVPPYLELKKYVPPIYVKNKTIEKDIMKEWRKLVGTTEQNAKYKYIQLCRSLKTWGITTYLCTIIDKQEKKKKPQKVLLGITRDSVLFLNVETKEIERTWLLKKLRRWAAAEGSKTITLDFGNYENDYVVLATDEAEAISALLAGYIDIILKARKENARVIEEDNENVATEETLVQKKAMAFATTTSIFSPSMNPYASTDSSVASAPTSSFFMTNIGAGAQYAKPTQLQMAVGQLGTLLEDINSSSQSGNLAQNSAMTQQQWWGQFQTSLTPFKTSMAGLLSLSQPGMVVSKSQLEEAAKLVAMNADNTLRAAKNAALSGKDPNNGLIQAARAVADSIKNILSCTELISRDPDGAGDLIRTQMLAHGQYQAGMAFFEGAVKGHSSDSASIELLLESGKNVAGSIYSLLDGLKNYTEGLPADQQTQLINLGKQLFFTNQLLGASANSLAPGAYLPEIRNQLKQGVDLTRAQMEALLNAAQMANGNSDSLKNLFETSRLVADALSGLIFAADASETEAKNLPGDLGSSLETIRTAAAEMRSKMGNRDAIIAGTKSIVGVINSIIMGSKSLAEASDPTTKALLLGASKGVADVIGQLVNASKLVIANGNDVVAQKDCLEALDKLETGVQELTDEALKCITLAVIRSESKKAAAACAHLVSTARTVAPNEVPTPMHNEVRDNANKAHLSNAALLELLGKAAQNASNESVQSQLVMSAQDTVAPAMNLVATSRKVQAKLAGVEKKHEIKLAADNVAATIQKLMEACRAYNKSAGSAEIEEATEQLESIGADLDATLFTIETGAMRASGSREDAIALLILSMKHLITANDKLKKGATAAPKQTPKLGKDVTFAVSEVVGAIKGVIGATPDKATQMRMIKGSKDLVNETTEVMNHTRVLSAAPRDAKVARELQESAQKLSSILSSVIAAARGFDSKIIDDATRVIVESSKRVEPVVPPKPANYDSSSAELVSNGKALSAALVQSASLAKSDPKGLGNAARLVASITPGFVDSSNHVAGTAPNSAIGQSVSDDTKELLLKIVGLLDAAKTTAANPDPSNDSYLSAALRDAQSTLSKLMGAAGNKEQNVDCKEALESVSDSISKIDNGEMISTDKSLPEALQLLIATVKALAATTSQVVASARSTPDALGKASKSAAEYVEQVVVAAKETVNATPQTAPEISSASKTIKAACRDMINNSSNTTALLQYARAIGTATAQMVMVAKKEAAANPNPEEQQRILSAVQAVVAATAGLARAAKGVQSQQPGAGEALLKAVADLEAANTQMLLASGKKEEQVNPADARKLVDNVRNVSATTSQLLSSAVDVSNKQSDPNVMAGLSAAAKAASESIAQLLKACSAMQPGTAEYEEAMDLLAAASGDIDSISISVAVGTLEAPVGVHKTHQESQEDIVVLSKALDSAISDIINATVLESPELLGKACKSVGASATEVVKALHNAVATTPDQNTRNELITASKDMVALLVPFVSNTRTAVVAGNKDAGREAQQQSKAVKESLANLVASMKTNAVLIKDLDETLFHLGGALNAVDSPLSRGDKPYEDAKDDLNDLAKALAFSVRKIVTTDKNHTVQIGSSAKAIGTQIPAIVEGARTTAALTNDASLRSAILTNVKQLAQATKAVVQLSRDGAADKTINNTAKLSDAFKNVTAALTKLLEAVKQGAVGEVLLDESLTTINDIIADIDAAALFAAAGQLEAEPGAPSGSPSELQRALIETAKLLAGNSSQLVGSTKSTREAFGQSAKTLSQSLGRLGALSKALTSALSDLNVQQQLLTSAKAISVASQQLVFAGKDVQRYKGDAATTATLNKGSQALAEAITNVINVAQNSEAENAKGIQELNAARNGIQGLLDGYANVTPAQSNAKDVVKSARAFAVASADLASSSNKGTVAEASKAAVEASKDLIEKTKGAGSAVGGDTNAKLTSSTKDIVSTMLTLINALKDQCMFGNAQQQISDSSSSVADKLSELMNAVKSLPGGEVESLQEAGGNLDEAASRELSAAAKVISDVAAALLAARPQKKVNANGIGFETDNVAAAIYDAAIAIAKATQTLVQYAAVSQSERVQMQQKNPIVYKADPMWANGLISAAKQVAGATQQLVRSANDAVNGTGREEELEAVAKLVSSATAQLVAASRAKSAQGSKSHSDLSDSAKIVASATNMLVKAAKDWSKLKEDEIEQDMANNYTGSAVKQLEQQMKVLKLEKELEKARKAMLDTRKGEYKK
eukprot:TRINITY_DN487_c0_g1_i1.p1 TRINITY_DN487_c0_g1~~TRINITY_DN487_c0_g1_i1.p1  ORF type:complete len:2445 (+),score=1078.48 TRINITY_DN487_c0_g1_i1:119-7453(+)